MPILKNSDSSITTTFSDDIKKYGTYQYTQPNCYSAYVANMRINSAVSANIPTDTVRVIDIGCGDGTYTKQLATSFPKIHFSGFDPTKLAIDFAKKQCKNIHFFIGDIYILKPPKKKYDVAIIRGVIHHVNDPLTALQKARLWAERIIIVEPNGNNLLLKVIEKYSTYHRVHKERSYSSSELHKFMSQAGIQRLSTHFIGFVPFFSPVFLARVILFLQPYLEKIPALSYFFGGQIVLVGETN